MATKIPIRPKGVRKSIKANEGLQQSLLEQETIWLELFPRYEKAILNLDISVPRFKKELNKFRSILGDPKASRSQKDEALEGLLKSKHAEAIRKLIKKVNDDNIGHERLLHYSDLFFLDPKIELYYWQYAVGRRKQGKKINSRQEWCRTTTAQAAVKRFKELAGEDYKKVLLRSSRLRPIKMGGIPTLFKPAELRRFAETIRKYELEYGGLLFYKLSIYRGDLTRYKPNSSKNIYMKPKMATSSTLTQLKGNIAEIFAHPHMIKVLSDLQKTEGNRYAEIALCKNIRADFDYLKNVEFTDGMIIGKTKDGKYQILHVFEVKSGRDIFKRFGPRERKPSGGKGARLQFHRNLEGREIEAIHLDWENGIKADGKLVKDRSIDSGGKTPAGKEKIDEQQIITIDYQRGGNSGTINGLFESEKTILAAKDQMKVNLEDEFRTSGKKTNLVPLEFTVEELKSIAAHIFSQDWFKSVI